MLASTEPGVGSTRTSRLHLGSTTPPSAATTVLVARRAATPRDRRGAAGRDCDTAPTVTVPPRTIAPSTQQTINDPSTVSQGEWVGLVRSSPDSLALWASPEGTLRQAPP